jgi:hypothetical protein
VKLQLLADIKEILGTDDAIFTRTLLAKLTVRRAPWSEYGKHRKPLGPSTHGAADSHGWLWYVTIDSQGIADTSPPFLDAFERYFPITPKNDISCAQHETVSVEDFSVLHATATPCGHI